MWTVNQCSGSWHADFWVDKSIMDILRILAEWWEEGSSSNFGGDLPLPPLPMQISAFTRFSLLLLCTNFTAAENDFGPYRSTRIFSKWLQSLLPTCTSIQIYFEWGIFFKQIHSDLLWVVGYSTVRSLRMTSLDFSNCLSISLSTGRRHLWKSHWVTAAWISPCHRWKKDASWEYELSSLNMFCWSCHVRTCSDESSRLFFDWFSLSISKLWSF